MTVAALEVGQLVVVKDFFRKRVGAVQAACHPLQVNSQCEQPGHPAQAHQLMRTPALMSLQRHVPGLQPHVHFRQLQIHRPLDARRGQRRQIVRHRRGLMFHSIDFGQGRLPCRHPAPLFRPVLRLPSHHRRIKERRGKPGEPAMSPKGAAHGGKRRGQVVRTTTPAPQATAIPASPQPPRGEPRHRTICVASRHIFSRCFSPPANPDTSPSTKRPTTLAQKLYRYRFLYHPWLNFCKCLIEVKKLYLFFTTFIFQPVKVLADGHHADSHHADGHQFRTATTYGAAPWGPYPCQSCTCSWYSSDGISLTGTVNPAEPVACSIWRRKLRARV